VLQNDALSLSDQQCWCFEGSYGLYL